MKGKPTTLHTLEIEFYIVSLGVSYLLEPNTE